jgi:flagellar protein FliS
MTQTEAGRYYLESEIRAASSVECVIIMYDMIVADLRKAMDCLRDGDIEGRSAAVKHSLAVLGDLQASLQMETGGEAAQHLNHFYSLARAKILEGQIKCRGQIFEEIVESLQQVRLLWGAIQKSCQSTSETAQMPVGAQSGWATAEEAAVPSMWSA